MTSSGQHGATCPGPLSCSGQQTLHSRRAKQKRGSKIHTFYSRGVVLDKERILQLNKIVTSFDCLLNPPSPPVQCWTEKPREEISKYILIATWRTKQPRAPSNIELGVKGGLIKRLQYSFLLMTFVFENCPGCWKASISCCCFHNHL